METVSKKAGVLGVLRQMKYAWIGLATVGVAGLLWVQYEAALLLHQTRETVESVRQQVNAIPLAEDALLKRVDKITESTNIQLTALNKQIAIGRRELLRQTETVVRHTNSAIDATTPVLASANAFVIDADKVIANDEIPRVIHNARLTTAFAGQAAVHIEGMANTIDQATPGFLKSAQAIADSGVKLADSGSKIASDFQQITDKAVAPVPAWKQSIGYITAVVKIGSVFF